MSISIQCPHCGTGFRLKDGALLGKKIKCRKCQKPFVASAPEEDPDDFLFSEEETAAVAPPPGLAGVKRKKKVKPKKESDEDESAAAAQQPKWFMPVMIGTATLVALGLLVGAGFLVKGALARTGGSGEIAAPTEWAKFRNPAEKFSCEYPTNWEKEGSESIGGGGMAWVRFRSGSAVINIRESPAGNAMGDIFNAGADPNEEDESMTPVAKLHEHHRERVAKDYSEYQESSVETIPTGMGDARRSIYTAKSGFSSKIRGYRVTYMNPRAQMNAMCECPEEDWEKAKPIFEKVIASVSP